MLQYKPKQKKTSLKLSLEPVSSNLVQVLSIKVSLKNFLKYIAIKE